MTFDGGTPTDTPGPLTRKVIDYERTLRGLVSEAKDPAEWASLTAFVAVDDFERVGTFREVQDWAQYTKMLTRWATATGSFETTIRRISEVGRLVYFEIEERHTRGDDVIVVNSLTVFEFDEADEIRHLAVYLQQG